MIPVYIRGVPFEFPKKSLTINLPSWFEVPPSSTTTSVPSTTSPTSPPQTTTTPTQLPSTTTTTTLPTCNMEHVKADVVFLFDSSKGLDRGDFKAVSSLFSNFFVNSLAITYPTVPLDDDNGKSTNQFKKSRIIIWKCLQSNNNRNSLSNVFSWAPLLVTIFQDVFSYIADRARLSVTFG